MRSGLRRALGPGIVRETGGTYHRRRRRLLHHRHLLQSLEPAPGADFACGATIRSPKVKRGFGNLAHGCRHRWRLEGWMRARRMEHY